MNLKMEDEIDSDQSVSMRRSESKITVGEKRSADEFEKKWELRPERVKMRDSVFRSEGIPACAYQMTSLGKHDNEHDTNFAKPKGFGWDLNREDVSTSLYQNPFHPYKNPEHLKSNDASECASSAGPLEEKDPMSVWKEMKQNGFLSSCHGGIPMPKPRGRKKKVDGPKKKMEIAKREQVDRFAKIAAPSGLLNELNPGIINHVRNSKQVLSIIEALVTSKKHENRKQAIPMSSERKDLENANRLDIHGTGLSCEDGSCSTLGGSQQKRDFPTLLSRPVYSKGDILALKLSSFTTMTSGNISCLSNEESENISSVSSLSVKAATVASQWLELLYQDTKGRLAALQRSKKRVQTVIHTELPLLMSQEFSSNKENDNENSTDGCSDNANADLHRARWNALFDHMDNSLSEEEKQLESWLNQVKDMKRHCEWGLQYFHCHALHGSQRQGTLENDSRLEGPDKSMKELALRAAAASIYSTCNLLMFSENLPCFSPFDLNLTKY